MNAADGLFPQGLQRVMAPVMLNPEQEFRHNELVKRAGPGRGAGQNAIRTMLRSRIALSRRLGNQLLISANKSHPLFPELRAICLKSFGVADRVSGALAPWSGEIEQAFLFGSVVKGTDRADSDLDLIVVGDIDLFALHAAIGPVEQELGRPVHVSAYGRDEWEAIRQEPVMASIVNGPKIMLVGNDPAA